MGEARGTSDREWDGWGRQSRGGMRRGHQHGVKDYPGLHSWVRKENRKQREGGKEQLRLVIARGKHSSYIPPAAPLPPPHVLQSLWYPSTQLPAVPARDRPQQWLI